jgi:NAD(P)-dependent dehydrogenase (short-subunit alcohol dehydrogenase family)
MAETGKPQHIQPQEQERQPGEEASMSPAPEYIRKGYQGANKLQGKVAIITGGDSGIGRAVAVHFAREGANVCVMYLDEHKDAEDTKKLVEAEGRKCIIFPGDIGEPVVAKEAVQRTIQELGGIDIVVNNAAEQHYKESIADITQEQLESTFRTNIFGMFYLVQAALPHLKEGSTIINSTSVTSYKGEPKLLDYSASKGAITAFTRALSQQLISKGIRVNAVAPGPIWTPFIPSTFPAGAQDEGWQKSVPMGRAGQPSECAPAYVFLASEDSSYFAGQVLHPNGGTVVNA